MTTDLSAKGNLEVVRHHIRQTYIETDRQTETDERTPNIALIYGYGCAQRNKLQVAM